MTPTYINMTRLDIGQYEKISPTKESKTESKPQIPGNKPVMAKKGS